MTDKKVAVIRSAKKPSDAYFKRFESFVKNKYGEEYTLDWIEEKSIKNGFKLIVGFDVYDWTQSGRMRQFKDRIREIDTTTQDVIPLIKESISDFSLLAKAEQIGKVVSIGDGIAIVSGLTNAFYGEILIFEDNVRGMVQHIYDGMLGCILFEDDGNVYSGSAVRRTGRVAGVPCSDKVVGRVVNALGSAIDGGAEIVADRFNPVETPAPGIIARTSVKRPLQTGILAIDSMFPIGKGQRELIIGDRQTGKTTLAVDTILNQKGKNVICVYVAIGQKISSVSAVVENLRKNGAMDYTTVVCASASDAAPLQYLAPYSGCAIAEYFMQQGKDVLIIYDDLSKHAVSYRAISLLLERSPGREAYPGDVFYLHSRLLERSAQLNAENGGGSMTALPIVETQAGDVSAYIPTNIISITDGQIFLESSLFRAGQRPAINVGLSVSRVGGDAQTAAMKKATGTLRLDLAQYREMEVFMQFASELDAATLSSLNYGKGLMAMLKQPKSSPLSVHAQVTVLTAALAKKMVKINTDKIPAYLSELVSAVESSCPQLCDMLDEGEKLSSADREIILGIADKITV